MSFFPPSLDQQLRTAREASGQKFLWAHIDTCLSCFLHDHHNRDGELLLGVYVDGSSTVGDVLDGLKDEFRQIGWNLGESRLGYDDEAAEAALDRLLAENANKRHLPFDASLDAPPWDEDEKFFDEEDNFDEEAFEQATLEWEREMEMGESCQAWFLLTWDLPDEDDEETE